MRKTETDLPEKAEKEVYDYWTDADSQPERMLSIPWTGKTIFWLFKKPLPPGKVWVNGVETRIQKTTRPDLVNPEEWRRLGKAAERRAVHQTWK